MADGACPFCDLPADREIDGNDLALAIEDRYPVSPGHTLVLTRRHVADWWQATPAERAAVSDLVDRTRSRLKSSEPPPTGFNVGFNAGESAGQTVPHLHVHVIPRFDGDMRDPRGGVRHVIPDKGNYLAGATHDERVDPGAAHVAAGANPGITDEESATAREEPATTGFGAADPTGAGPRSTAEATLERLVEPTDLTRHVLALIQDGRKSATYKPALMLALLELATERFHDDEALELPMADVAERVIELYWPQLRPYGDPHQTLRQSTGKRSAIRRTLLELLAASHATGTPSLHRVRRDHPDDFRAARRRIAETLAQQPVPRLQRPGQTATADSATGTASAARGASAAYPRFLYDDSMFTPGRRPPKQIPPIRLRRGVARALAHSAPLLRQAIEEIWTQEVARYNKIAQDQAQLRAFLFGSDRTSLRPVADGLHDAGFNRCFWCDDRLLSRRRTEVDHVIPWSLNPNDELYNLVLSHQRCNNDKRDRLVTAPLVERWAGRDAATRSALTTLAADISWPFDPGRSLAIARSAYQFLPAGNPVWNGVRQVVPFTEEQRGRILRAIAA